jgi:hypothetical protein
MFPAVIRRVPVVAWMMALAACPSAAEVDAGALRLNTEPAVCRVVVEGPLGLPIASASGFLMGKGGFVVTDLAAVAQPGAAKVTVEFGDGAKAEAATTILSAPGTPKNVREAALDNTMGLLDALRQVSTSYRTALRTQAAADLEQADAAYPRGFLTYAEVAETVNLRGDAFTVLLPQDASTPLIVNADMLAAYYGPVGGEAGRPAGYGQSVVTGGTLVGPVTVQGQRLMFARLFGWADGPSAVEAASRRALVNEGPEPTAVAAGSAQGTETASAGGSEPSERSTTVAAPRRRPRPPRPERREKKPGEPNFFGL